MKLPKDLTKVLQPYLDLIKDNTFVQDQISDRGFGYYQSLGVMSLLLEACCG